MGKDEIACYPTQSSARKDGLDHKMHSNRTTSMDIAEWVFLAYQCSQFIHPLPSALLLSLKVALFGTRSTKKVVRPVTAEDVKHDVVLCSDPIKHWHNWEAATMAAGTDGVPQPLKYTSNNKTAHRLSVYDVDKRDMRMAIYVDDILRGLTSEFDLDLEEDCELDVYMCAQKHYSAGWLVIPSGKHEVRIEWNGKGISQLSRAFCVPD